MSRILIVTWFTVSCCACACNKKQKLFTLLSSHRTGIDFSNTIRENDSINILDLENMYNGGGVGIGDFNNDGLHGYLFYRQSGSQ